MHPVSPLTLADWQQLWLAGAPLVETLQALRRRLASDSPAAAWIERVDEAGLSRRLADLERRAAAFDDRAAVLRAMPFFGVPFAVKDNIDVAGLPTTAACPAYAYRPERDAEAVARLLRAGAVCIGKTNLDQFATGLSGARSPYGRPSSTFAADRISGGSSSGSAVVVARGDVAFALATDTAGSGRVPAGFNNLVGLKPTPGRVSGRGLVPACRSIDCISVLALTVADAAAVLAVIEGPDPEDAYSAYRPGPALLAPGRRGTGLRIGIPSAPIFAGDAGYAPCFAAAVAHAGTLGHELRPIDAEPLLAVGRMLYDGPWVAERHAVVEPMLRADPAAIDPTVRQVIESAARFSATDAFRSQYALREAGGRLQRLWADVDLLMVPTAPAHPTHAELDADPLGANAQLGAYTNFVNLLGWCALALPAGFTGIGLPFGITLIAPGGADAALARVGAAWAASLRLPLGATGRAPAGTRVDATVDATACSPVDATVGSPIDATVSSPVDATVGSLVDALADRPVDALADRPVDAQAGSPVGPGLPWPASRPTLPVAVVGAHLSGMPLNGQLTERGATLLEATQTAARYRLHALPGSAPPKPGLQRVAADGAAIAVEVWEVPSAEIGSFLALIPPPLGLGSIELADGRWVRGFICEGHALGSARDITAFGGWRAYLAAS